MRHRTALISLITLGLVLCCGVALALDLPNPEPTSFRSRGFGYVAEIFPPKSRQNPGVKPLCYLYRVNYIDTHWNVNARLKWQAKLTTRRMAHEAVASFCEVIEFL